MTVATSIKLDDALAARLKELGECLDRSPHWLMKQAIADYVDQQERFLREKMEEDARWEAYKATGEHIPNDVVMDWLDSIGTDDEQPCPV